MSGDRRDMSGERIEVHPLTSERWDDFEALFGPRGACAGCWCTYWRQTNKQYEQNGGNGNRQMMLQMVEDGHVPGLLAYVGGQAVGWVSVALRDEFSRLERSRVLKRVDERPTWSVVCFFVSKQFRKRGLTKRLLEAAVEYARRQGAQIVEGYPIEPKKDAVPPVFAYTGFSSTFKQVGFEEAARRSETRPLMRMYLEKD